jgi:hypothetical protein
MAHFAILDEGGIVTSVIAVDNRFLTDESGIEQESLGKRHLAPLGIDDERLIQTSYNSNFRKNYAGIGMKYYADLDAFLRVKPYPSWILNESGTAWKAPVEHPQSESLGTWDEAGQRWILNDEANSGSTLLKL